jgi:hypothetical protein
MTPCLHRFATSGLRKLMIPDLHRFVTSGLRRFKIPDLHRFATPGHRRFKIPDLHRVNHPENLFHEFRQIRRFEGDMFFLNSPTSSIKSSIWIHTWTQPSNGKKSIIGRTSSPSAPTLQENRNSPSVKLFPECQKPCRICWCVGLHARVVDLSAFVPEMWLSTFMLTFFLQVLETSPCRGGVAEIFKFSLQLRFLSCYSRAISFLFSAALRSVVEPCQRVAGVARRGIPSWSIAGIARLSIPS